MAERGAVKLQACTCLVKRHVWGQEHGHKMEQGSSQILFSSSHSKDIWSSGYVGVGECVCDGDGMCIRVWFEGSGSPEGW